MIAHWIGGVKGVGVFLPQISQIAQILGWLVDGDLGVGELPGRVLDRFYVFMMRGHAGVMRGVRWGMCGGWGGG